MKRTNHFWDVGLLLNPGDSARKRLQPKCTIQSEKHNEANALQQTRQIIITVLYLMRSDNIRFLLKWEIPEKRVFLGFQTLWALVNK